MPLRNDAGHARPVKAFGLKIAKAVSVKEQQVAQSLSVSLITARGKTKGRKKQGKEGRKERRKEPDAGGVTKEEEEKEGTGRGWGN